MYVKVNIVERCVELKSFNSKVKTMEKGRLPRG